MKKITTVLLLSFLISTFSSSGQWTVNTTPVSGYYAAFSIHYIDNNIGFVGGNTALFLGNGVINKTSNGGNTWTNVLSVPNTTIKDICFINDNLGFAVGSGGLIAKTIDGGDNWNTQIYTNPNTMNNEAFESVFFVDENIGYIAGGFNEMWVLKTIDGGVNWLPLTMPTYFQRLKTVYFTDATTGYVAGGDGTSGGLGKVYKTVNGGTTWSPLNTGVNTNYYNDIFFTDANNGVLGCAIDGTLLRTTNAGVDWTTVINPAGTDAVQEFSFVNTMLGYAAILSGKIIKTTDGGANWTVDGSVTPIISALYSITVPTQSYGATVGLFGFYAELSGSSGIYDLHNEVDLSVYPNPTTGIITVDIVKSNDYVKATLMNNLGQVILTKEYNSTNTIKLNINESPNGVYFLVLESKDGILNTKKIIKK